MGNNASCIIRTESASKDGSHRFLEWLANGFDMNIDRKSGENSMGAKVVMNFGWRKPGTDGPFKGIYYVDIAEWCSFVNAVRSGRIYSLYDTAMNAFRSQNQYKYPNANSAFAVWKFPLKGTSAEDLRRQGRERRDKCCESRSLVLYPAMKEGSFCWYFNIGPGEQKDNIIAPFNAKKMADYRAWMQKNNIGDSAECMSIPISQTFDEFEGQIFYVDDVRKCYLQRQVNAGAFEWAGRKEKPAV